MLVAVGCGGDSKEPSPGPGVITVNGSERLAWSQAGDVAGLRFRAYVDDRAVDLAAAACDGTAPEAACSSPLPPLSNGVHTLALAAVEKLSRAESDRSAPITVQKVPGGTGSAGAASTATFSRYRDRAGSLRLETTVSTSDGQTYAVDLIADGLKAPARLAWAPDGRLFVAEADSRVRVIRPNERDTGARETGDWDDRDTEVGKLALDSRTLLDPPPVGPMGIALHPDFAQNHFVYLSFLLQDSRDRAVLRVTRLRDVDGAFGEAATIFEALLRADPANREGGGGTGGGWAGGVPPGGPRLAFGPDGLLYVALPHEVEFDGEPTASAPHASLLRLSDDGRVPPDVAAIAGVVARPIAFDWHPGAGDLWAVFPADSGGAELRRVTAGAPGGVERGRSALRVAAAGGGRTTGALRFQRTLEGRSEHARAFLTVPENEALSVVTLAEPVRVESLLPGMFGRIGDMVAGAGGTLFLVTWNGERSAEAGRPVGDLVFRLTPLAR